jgi:hypothetical protein
MTVRFVVRCFAIVALLLSAQVARAQQQTPAEVLNQAQLANGGRAMEDAVQNLMTADKANLAAIIAFAKTANEDQRRAIGKGLANVAKAYAAGGDPANANSIQQAVVNSGLPELAKAYADAGGDTGTASIGGGGGTGGLNSPPTGGPNTGTTVGGNSFAANQASNLSGGNVGGGGFSSSSPR